MATTKANAAKEAKPAKAAPVKKAAAPAKEKASKPAKSGAKLTVVQVGSPIGRQKDQEATLIGLGLNKMHRQRELEDTPAVRGMINKVRHLVRVVE